MVRKAILIPGELNSKGGKMLISVKLLAKHVKIFFFIGFGTWKVRSLNQSRSNVAPKSKFPAELGGKNG